MSTQRSLMLVALFSLAACDAKKATAPTPASSAEVRPKTAPVPAATATTAAVGPVPSDGGPAGATDAADARSPTTSPTKPRNPREMTKEDLLAIEGVLGEQLGTSVEVSAPQVNQRDEARHAYVIYEHEAVSGCEGCPTKAELALNPDCKAYGIAYAKFAGSAPTVVAQPLREVGCELELVTWVVDEAMLLEVVSSNVRKWDRKAEEPVLTARRQRAFAWRWAWTTAEDLREPPVTLELAQWQSRRGTEDPPVRASAFLYEANGIKLVELLPCLDPWSDEACSDDVRRRNVHDL
ncbi:MAG: hypothetical protein R3B48_07985 [Kofleriaceae bacterium]